VGAPLTMWVTTAEIWAQEGVRGFYKGVVPRISLSTLLTLCYFLSALFLSANCSLLLLHCCKTVVTRLLHGCYIDTVTLLLHCSLLLAIICATCPLYFFGTPLCIDFFPTGLSVWATVCMVFGGRINSITTAISTKYMPTSQRSYHHLYYYRNDHHHHAHAE
jgi:hypothetical protein